MREGLVIWLILLALLLFLSLCVIWEQRKKQQRLLGILRRSADAEEEAKRRKETLDAMLPSKLLSVLKKEGFWQIGLGEEKNIRAAVLSFNLRDFSERIRNQGAEEIFEFVNGVQNHVVPPVLYQEGEIEKFADAGFDAFFLDSAERALRAAVSICEGMKQGGYGGLPYSIGLSYGDVMVGMVGHGKRCGVLTISETKGIAEFLQELAGRYGARILISGSMKRQIPDFEKHYSSRYLGCMYVKAAGTEEELYEVYDGDDPADRNGKRRTRLLFEKGVDLFQKKQFYDARIHFIEVLKANRMDEAAKRYLYLCNRYLMQEEKAGDRGWLEIY